MQPSVTLSLPVLETDRLLLRPPAPEDIDPWCDFMADQETARFVGGVQSRTLAWRSMAGMAGAWLVRGYSMFSVIEKVSGAWVGRLGAWQPEGWPGTEVGWGLARSAWGKGYAQEGATAAIDWAFTSLGWQEVIHCIDPANAPSRKLAKRLGSRVLRHARLPEPLDVDVEVWGQSRDEWFTREERA